MGNTMVPEHLGVLELKTGSSRQHWVGKIMDGWVNLHLTLTCMLPAPDIQTHFNPR